MKRHLWDIKTKQNKKTPPQVVKLILILIIKLQKQKKKPTFEIIEEYWL